MATKPHSNTRLAKYVTRRISELGGRKTQAEIASEAGFANSNMISMIKSGATKLALDRVPQLSKALECDPAFLLRLALEQSLGATAAKSVHDIFGTPLTRNEIEWILELRDASGDTDPRLTARSRAAFRGIFGK
nr:helix-turn-helix transcriptional regulator [Pararhodobacter sp. SW119]